MFAKAVSQSSPCFAYVDLRTYRAGYAIYDIYGDACKVVSDVSGSIGSGDVNFVRNKGESFASYAFKFEGSWLVVCLKSAPNSKVTYVFVAFE